MDHEDCAAQAAQRQAVRLMSRVLGSLTGFVVGEGWGSQWRDGEWHPGIRSQLLAYTVTGLVTYAWQRDHGFDASPTDTVRAALERWAADRGELEERQIPCWLRGAEAFHLRAGAPTETVAALRSGWAGPDDSTVAVLRAAPLGLLGIGGFTYVRDLAVASAADDDIGLVEVIGAVVDSRPTSDPMRWRLEHLLRQDPRSLRHPAQRPAPEGPDDVVVAALAALLAYPGGERESWLAAIRSVVEAHDPVGVRCLVGLLHGALYCPGYTPDAEPGVAADARLWPEVFGVLGALAEDVVLGLLAMPAGSSEEDLAADAWCQRYPA